MINAKYFVCILGSGTGYIVKKTAKYSQRTQMALNQDDLRLHENQKKRSNLIIWTFNRNVICTLSNNNIHFCGGVQKTKNDSDLQFYENYSVYVWSNK